jgi:predicted DNA-binding ribbon-helix-helix protein
LADKITFDKNSITFQIYKFITERRAVTTKEIFDAFKDRGIRYCHISSYLRQIMQGILSSRAGERLRAVPGSAVLSLFTA